MSAAAALDPGKNPKRILLFGDSLTWGWVPNVIGAPSERFATAKQWPSALKSALNNDAIEVYVDAVCGRTTDIADPTFPQLTGSGLDGSAALPAVIAAHLPLDLVVIMLGTNDTKAQFARTAFRIALGAGRLVAIVQSSSDMFGAQWYMNPTPKVLLISPPPLGAQNVFAPEFAGGEERSRGLARAYAFIAQAARVAFFDAGSAIDTDGVDGVHISEEAQRKLGLALAVPVQALLA